MHQAVCVVVLACQSEGLAEGKCVLQAFSVEIRGDVVGAEFKYAHGDASYLEVSGSDEASVVGMHGHSLPLFQIGRERFGERA